MLSYKFILHFKYLGTLFFTSNLKNFPQNMENFKGITRLLGHTGYFSHHLKVFFIREQKCIIIRQIWAQLVLGRGGRKAGANVKGWRGGVRPYEELLAMFRGLIFILLALSHCSTHKHSSMILIHQLKKSLGLQTGKWMLEQGGVMIFCTSTKILEMRGIKKFRIYF